MLQSNDIAKKMLARGIDSYSARANILEGYSEDILNADVKSSGQLIKRKGYEGHRGWLPLRVKTMAHVGTAIYLTFDDSQAIDLSAVGSCPIVVQGKLNVNDGPTSDPDGGFAGDFSATPQAHYYDSFTVSNRLVLSTGLQIPTYDAATTGLTSPYSFVGICFAEGAATTSHYVMGLSNIEIDEVSYSVAMEYLGSENGSGFFYFLDKTAESGVTYVHTATSNTTFTIAAATHNLSNYNLGVRCFDNTISAGKLTEVLPSLVSISSSGTVTVTFASAFEGYIILTACPVLNVTQQTVSGAGTYNIEVDVDQAFNFFYVYSQSGGTLESIIPSSISYDETTSKATIEYVLAGGAETVVIFHEPADSIANRIQITDTGAVSESYATDYPELTVWGIPHNGIYRDATLRGGHVTHIDNYKSATEEFLVAGIGGNFYRELDQAAGSTDYLMPSSSIQLRSRVENGPVTIAPLFAGTGRTRGVITDASIADYKAPVTAATYVSDGVVDYTLSFTSKTGTISTSISTGYDKLTVSNMANGVHNGAFVISSVQSESSTSAVIRCVNTDVVNAITDEAGAAGEAGVFTDKIELEATHKFIPNDRILYAGIDEDTYNYVVSGGSGSDLYVDNVEAPYTFPDGLQLYGRRTGYVLPLQVGADTLSCENYVRGDMLSTSAVTFQPRVERINVESNTAVTIVGDGEEATATAGAAHGYQAGYRVIIYNSQHFAGEWLITDVPSETTFTFAHTYDGSGSGTVQGLTVQIDSNIQWEDNLSPDTFEVVGRWVPIEIPTNSESSTYSASSGTYSQYPNTCAYMLTSNPYDDQNPIRSTMVSDNMYLLNYTDEVYKVDGSNVYRAGLPTWQPQLFVQFDTGTASLLKGYSETYVDADIAGKYFVVSASTFQAGNRIYDSYTGRTFTVVEVATDSETHGSLSTTHHHVIVAESTAGLDETGTSHTLTLVKQYQYYARLTMIDANDNIIATAATGHNDCIVEQVADGQFHHKLILPPAVGYYDYDRIEVELYRTQANTPGAFYLVKRSSVSYLNHNGYIEFDDGTPDSLLVDSDPINVLKAGELGTGWEQPPRAKYLTSASNRLILGNIKSYPRWDIVLRPTGSSLTASNLNGFSLLFRKDSASSSTTPSQVQHNLHKFVFTNANAVTIDATAGDIANGSTGFTIYENSHGLVIGDWVYCFHAAAGADNDLRYAGWYRVVSKNTNDFTLGRLDTVNTFTFTAAVDDTITATAHGLSNGDIIRVASSSALPAGLAAATNYYVINAATDTFKVSTSYGGGAVNITDTGTGTHTATVRITGTAKHIDRYVTAGSGAEEYVPVWIGTDGNYNQKDGNTTGSVEYIAALRLSNAINAVSKQQYVVPGITGATDNNMAWLSARGGNDVALGQISVECQRVLSSTPEVVLGTVASTFEVYINNIKRTTAEQVSASSYVMPSRIAISYENYPELFDNILADAAHSDSVVDINSADGQEITGLIPFYGDSTFGQGALNQMVVVFKTNSIYILDVLSKDYQKIDSRGLGCTAPYSIAPTKNGIMFANSAGIYRLNRDMSISFVGKMVDGLWKESVNLDRLTEATATQYAELNQYKLSIPTSTDLFNSEVYVYNNELEGQGQEYGAWTRYDSHPATGWANQVGQAFFATNTGDVMAVKNTGEVEDYRDDADAISTVLTLKPEDFDLPSVRKVINSVSLQTEYQTCTGLAIETAVNLTDTFESAGSITSSTAEDLNIQASPAKRKGNFFQVKITHATKDEALTIAGVSYGVARLDTRGSTRVADK